MRKQRYGIRLDQKKPITSRSHEILDRTDRRERIRQRKGAEFREAKKRLEGLDKAERDYEKEVARKCDWDRPEDVAAYRKDFRAEKRIKLLGRLVPSRCCPRCGTFIVSIRSWIVNKRKSKAICKRCYMDIRKDEPDMKKVRLDYKIFPEKEVFYVIDGVELKRVRKVKGMSQLRLGEEIGVDRSVIAGYETGVQRTIGSIRAKLIMSILESREIFPEEDIFYVIDGANLRKARNVCGVSQAKFSEKMGVSHSYVGQLETGSQRTIGLFWVEVILDTLSLYNKMTLDVI